MPPKTRTAENDKRMEELRRLMAIQDVRFEEANAKITAANQKIEGVDAKIDALNAKLDLFISQEDAIYAKQDQQVAAINETMVEDKTNVMEYIDAKVTELFNAKRKKKVITPYVQTWLLLHGQIFRQSCRNTLKMMVVLRGWKPVLGQLLFCERLERRLQRWGQRMG
jgi:uncharacterized coiled-coil protein SlyX